MISKTVSLLVCIGGLAAVHTARADEYVGNGSYVGNGVEEEPSATSYDWSDPRLESGIGVGIVVGGGITGFTSKTMRDTVTNDVGGLWDARLSLGTHIPIGIEFSYLGTLSDVQTLTGADTGRLVGTTAEADLRWNILPHAYWDPYVFGGVGYQRYDVTNTAFSLTDTGMKSNDNMAEFPMGVGFSFRDPSGLMVDLRGTYRYVTQSTLVLNEANGSFASLNTWEADAALGYVF